MDLGLKGKTAIVAASTKGLGKASALALAREGANVTLCARGEDRLEVAAQEIHEQTGAQVLAVQADLRERSSIERVVASTVERFGGVDVLVNNCGGPPVGQFDSLSDDDWQTAFEIVTLGFVRFTRAVIPHMRSRGWGRIVGIQSSSVKEPVIGIASSNGTRPGIAGLMKSLTPELAREGITINLVLPGRFLTERIHPDLGSEDPAVRSAAEQQLAPLAEQVPVGRLGDPIELGHLVAFLASEQAAYITGAVYQVDGGLIGSNV